MFPTLTTPYRWLGYSLLLLMIASASFLGYVAAIAPAPAERTEEVFVYGTLTNPFIRLATCRCLVALEPVTLPDYRKQGLTIIPDPSATVTGGIISISPTELARLDTYERVPTRYRREEITITGQTMWVYIKN